MPGTRPRPRYVEDIVSESDRLSRLVSALLTLARSDAGRLTITREPVDLSALGAGLVREFQAAAGERGLELAGEIEPAILVEGDPDRLRELGILLLDNALRYTERGMVSVRVAAEKAGALLSVEDTGPGIAPEHLPHLFERFYRTDPARAADAGGAGLGLAIAQWIARAHGGQHPVSSALGRGSRFTLHLPRRLAEPPALPDTPPVALGQSDDRLPRVARP